MSNIRTFELYGLANGQFINLTNNIFFLNLPKGLGIKIKNEYFTLGTLRIKTNSAVEYEDITGNLLIKSYKDYDNFRKFIAINREKGFKLYYTPKNENLKRYVICDIVQLQKTEIEQYGYLNCPITITPKTNWMTDKQFILNFVESDITNVFPITFPIRFDRANSGEVELTNNGDFEIPLEIILYGQLTNPFLRLLDINNQVIQTALFNIEINEGESFVINSEPDNLQIYLLNTDNDRIDKTTTQDYTKVTYLTLPVGTFTLKVNDTNDNEISGIIKAQENYLGA